MKHIITMMVALLATQILLAQYEFTTLQPGVKSIKEVTTTGKPDKLSITTVTKTYDKKGQLTAIDYRSEGKSSTKPSTTTYTYTENNKIVEQKSTRKAFDVHYTINRNKEAKTVTVGSKYIYHGERVEPEYAISMGDFGPDLKKELFNDILLSIENTGQLDYTKIKEIGEQEGEYTIYTYSASQKDPLAMFLTGIKRRVKLNDDLYVEQSFKVKYKRKVYLNYQSITDKEGKKLKSYDAEMFDELITPDNIADKMPKLKYKYQYDKNGRLKSAEKIQKSEYIWKQENTVTYY